MNDLQSDKSHRIIVKFTVTTSFPWTWNHFTGTWTCPSCRFISQSRNSCESHFNLLDDAQHIWICKYYRNWQSPLKAALNPVFMTNEISRQVDQLGAHFYKFLAQTRESTSTFVFDIESHVNYLRISIRTSIPCPLLPDFEGSSKNGN